VRFLSVAAFVLAGACSTPYQLRGARLPQVDQAEANVVLEGSMEVLIEDSKPSSRILYFLISGDRRVPLRFMSPPPNLTTGTRVRVRGRWAEDHVLVVTSLERI
jgi:hypothetical protein